MPATAADATTEVLSVADNGLRSCSVPNAHQQDVKELFTALNQQKHRPSLAMPKAALKLNMPSVAVHSTHALE